MSSTANASQSPACTTSVTARVGGVRSVAPAANVQIPFDGSTTSKILIIRADGAFNARFGGAAVDPVAVKPVASGQEAFIAVSAEATSIYIENPGTASINVKWLLGAV